LAEASPGRESDWAGARTARISVCLFASARVARRIDAFGAQFGGLGWKVARMRSNPNPEPVAAGRSGDAHIDEIDPQLLGGRALFFIMPR
jgi:hypothetical protein